MSLGRGSLRYNTRRMTNLADLLEGLYAEYHEREKDYASEEGPGEEAILERLGQLFKEARSGQGLNEFNPRRRDVSPPAPVPPGCRLVRTEEIRLTHKNRHRSRSESDEPEKSNRVVKSKDIDGVRVKYSFPAKLYKRLKEIAAEGDDGVTITFDIPTHEYEANPSRYSPEVLLHQAQQMVYPPAPQPLPQLIQPPATPPVVVVSAPQPQPQVEVVDEQDVFNEVTDEQPKVFDIEWGPRRHTEGRAAPKITAADKE